MQYTIDQGLVALDPCNLQGLAKVLLAALGIRRKHMNASGACLRVTPSVRLSQILAK